MYAIRSYYALQQAELDVRRLQGLMSKKLVAEESLNRATTALAIARAEERLLNARLGYMTIVAPFRNNFV